MKPSLQKLYKTIQDFYHIVLEQISTIEKEIESEVDLKELADYAYALRESKNSLEALEKELHKLQEWKTEKKLAYLSITQAPGERIKTKYCSADVDVKTAVSIPKKQENPAVYDAMCDDLQIREDLRKHEVVRIHYPGFVEWLTERAANGLPKPAWAEESKEYNAASVNLRKLPRVNIGD